MTSSISAEYNGKLCHMCFGCFWGTATLTLSPEMINQATDQELVDLCRWFANNATELQILGSFYECGDYHHGIEEIRLIAKISQDEFVIDWARQLLQKHSQQQQIEDEPPESKKKVPQVGYVYFLKGDDFCKIGRTVDLDSRITTIRPKLPFETELALVIETDDPTALEIALHDRFAAKRANGEWFALTDEDIAWIEISGREWWQGIQQGEQ